jgi:hypothetical protein
MSLFNCFMILQQGALSLTLIFNFVFNNHIIIFNVNLFCLILIVLIIIMLPILIISNLIYPLIIWINSLNRILIQFLSFISFNLNIDISRWWRNIFFILSYNQFLEMVKTFSWFSILLVFQCITLFLVF